MKVPPDYSLRPFEQTILHNCGELSQKTPSGLRTQDTHLLFEFSQTLSDGYVSDNLLKAMCAESTQFEHPAHIDFIARVLSKNPERSHDVSQALRKHHRIEMQIMETFRSSREGSDRERSRVAMSRWGAAAAAICLAFASHMVHEGKPTNANATASKPAAVRAAKSSTPADTPHGFG